MPEYKHTCNDLALLCHEIIHASLFTLDKATGVPAIDSDNSEVLTYLYQAYFTEIINWLMDLRVKKKTKTIK